MVLEIKEVVTWLKQWFYDKNDVYNKQETYSSSQVDSHLAGKLNSNLTTANKMLVTDGGGDVILEDKVNITGKADKTNGVSQITDSNSHTYTNIGSLSSGSTQQSINSALNTIIGVLKGTKLIEIENKPSTASESTMGKLYVVTESGKVNVYYTKQSGTGSSATYSWQKLDANILDDLSDATQSTHGLMSALDKLRLDTGHIPQGFFDDFEIYQEITCTLITEDEEIQGSSFFEMYIMTNVKSDIAQYDDMDVSIMSPNGSRKTLMKLSNDGSGTDFVTVKDIRRHGAGLLVYWGSSYAYLVNVPQKEVTSYTLVQKDSDPTSDASKGMIKIYFGDEPSGS